MSALDRPRLRPHLTATPDRGDPRYIVIWDRLGLADGPRRVTLQEYAWVQLFDGRRTLRDIQLEAIRRTGGDLVPLDRFAALAQTMEAALFLDGPRFRERLSAPIREPACLGCYEPEPEALRRQLGRLFTGRGGPGLPGKRRTHKERLRAALIPHIDYARGGVSYGWGFKEVVEQTEASLFVIIGTSHYSLERFTLTRKHFKTPLGIVPTDHAYVDRLVAHYGDGLFDDELAQLPEHSIELEVVLLQFLYAERRPFRIVPLVVGSFQDCVHQERAPSTFSNVRRMVAALRHVEKEVDEPICYIISGDLAHIGPKFGDPHPVREPLLSESRERDQVLLSRAEAADGAGYFQLIAAEDDRRRICGLPPTYTLLEAIQPRRGRRLHYEQYVHPHGYESVSFASMAFYE
jgi:AmmeMemoRadiSam system protein B